MCLTCSRNQDATLSFFNQVGDDGADRFNGSLKSLEIALGLEAHNSAALRATIATQQNAGCESIKIGQNEPMPPRSSDFAARANFGPGPQIIPAFRANILEKSSNKQYHSFTLLRCFKHLSFEGGEFCENSRPFLIKKASFPRPNYSDTTRLLVKLF